MFASSSLDDQDLQTLSGGFQQQENEIQGGSSSSQNDDTLHSNSIFSRFLFLMCRSISDLSNFLTWLREFA